MKKACNLGNAYAASGDTRKAIDYYEQQLKITHETGDRAQPVECAKSALKIREEIEDPRADKVRRKLQEWDRQHHNQ